MGSSILFKRTALRVDDSDTLSTINRLFAQGCFFLTMTGGHAMGQTLSINAEVLTTDLAAAFSEIECVYQPCFSNAICCLTGDAQVSEKLVQETLSRAYSMLKQFSPEQIQNLNLKPWLCGIALTVTNTWLKLHTEHAEMEDTATSSRLS
jgi:hypothetical protein